MSLEKHVNNSGFPLQLGLAHQIKSTNQQHGWSLLYQEHGWKNATESGFIDIVIEDKTRTLLMNIECKRVLDTSWIFLVPTSHAKLRRHCKMWVSTSSDAKVKCYDWIDIPIDPETYQSQFCVVPGQDPKARPMLERTAASVVASTEALAFEEARSLSKEYSHLRIYMNIIVTTAGLKVCKVDPAKIDLTNGMLQDAQFEDVPYIRFRKQMSHPLEYKKPKSWPDQVHALISQKENSVFIVQASKFIEFINAIEMPDDISEHVTTANL